MAVKVISDLHSGVEALAREIHPDDTLLLLGDLINVIDYRAMDGILVEVYGTEAVTEVVQLRAQRRFDDARAVMQRRREGREEEMGARFQELIREAYRRVAEVLPTRTYLILGNVDSPGIAVEVLSECAPGAELVDGKVVEIDGMRIGFVGGGLPTPLGVPGEVSEDEFDAKLAALGRVDVVCSHVPPDLPELTYDTVARRRERGSAALLAYVRDVQPLRVFFGHIHQPLLSSTHVGRTHLMNAGYFRRTERAIPIAL